MAPQTDRTQFVQAALHMTETVTRFVGVARAYFYAVVLSKDACPSCGGRLTMIAESRCRCDTCGRTLDPTVAFQQCSTCGGQLRLTILRYACAQCGADVPSRFVFDGLVFDAEYFRRKMAEHRAQKEDLRDRVRHMLAGSRSPAIESEAVATADMGDLFAALNQLVLEAVEIPALVTKARFDLRAYEAHAGSY